MKNFKKSKTALLILTLAFLVLGIVSVCLVFVFGRTLSYVPMTVFAFLCAVGFYGFAFAYRRRIFITACERIICEAKEGRTTVSSLCNTLCIKEKALVKIIKKGKKQGLIEDSIIFLDLV